MSSSQELYNRLEPKLRAVVPVRHRKHLTNWLWVVVGILQSQSVNLSQIANHLPHPTQATSRVTLIRRWLMNPHIPVWPFYKRVLHHVLADWRAGQVYLILDGVMVFGDRWQIFRVSLQHGCRAIPLAWTIVPGKGLVKVPKLRRMLSKVQKLLPGGGPAVTLLADAGFRSCAWAQLCQELGWHYAIRLASHTHISAPEGLARRLDRRVPVACNRYFQNVGLTRKAQFRTNVSVTWEPTPAGTWKMVAIMTDQCACRARLREYARRMSIEQSFRDDNSGGFDLAHTRLQHAQRLNHLLLALAIATLWCHELGEFVLQQGEATRRQIDPAARRTLSVFQLGLRWLLRVLTTGVGALPDFQACLSNLKLKPVVLPVRLNSSV